MTSGTKGTRSRIFQVELVNGLVDHLVAEPPVFQHLPLRVRFREERQLTLCVGMTGEAIGMLDFTLLMLPGAKRSFVRLQVKVREEQSVVSDLPNAFLRSVLNQTSLGQR